MLGLNCNEGPRSEVSDDVDHFDVSNIGGTISENIEEMCSLETEECVELLVSFDTPLSLSQEEETQMNEQQLDFVLLPHLSCEKVNCGSITTIESDGSYRHWLSSLENNSVCDQQVADDDMLSLVEFIAAEKLAVRLNSISSTFTISACLKVEIGNKLSTFGSLK